jgi:pyruvate kinase
MQINPVHVNSGDELRLAFANVQQTPKNIPVDYPHLNEITTQTRILLDDGLVESQVVQNRGDELIVQMMNDGPIGTGKKVTDSMASGQAPLPHGMG